MVESLVIHLTATEKQILFKITPASQNSPDGGRKLPGPGMPLEGSALSMDKSNPGAVRARFIHG